MANVLLIDVYYDEKMCKLYKILLFADLLLTTFAHDLFVAGT